MMKLHLGTLIICVLGTMGSPGSFAGEDGTRRAEGARHGSMQCVVRPVGGEQPDDLEAVLELKLAYAVVDEALAFLEKFASDGTTSAGTAGGDASPSGNDVQAYPTGYGQSPPLAGYTSATSGTLPRDRVLSPTSYTVDVYANQPRLDLTPLREITLANASSVYPSRRPRDTSSRDEKPGAGGGISIAPRSLLTVSRDTLHTVLVSRTSGTASVSVEAPPWLRVSPEIIEFDREGSVTPVTVALNRTLALGAVESGASTVQVLQGEILFTDAGGNSTHLAVTKDDFPVMRPPAITSAGSSVPVLERSLRCWPNELTREELDAVGALLPSDGVACLGRFYVPDSGTVVIAHESGGPQESELMLVRLITDAINPESDVSHSYVQPDSSSSKGKLSAYVQSGTHRFYLQSLEAGSFYSDDILVSVNLERPDALSTQERPRETPVDRMIVDVCTISPASCMARSARE